MRAGVIVTGVLGVGSALVFALAIAVSAMFPNGGSIASTFGGMVRGLGGPVSGPIAVPAPAVILPVPMMTIGPSMVDQGPSDIASPAR